MLLALDKHNEEKIRAMPGMKAICPGCQEEVIARCGDINIWHWAHKAGLCKYDYEPETRWHLEWKENALKLGMEIEKIFDTSQRYRADIYDPKRNMVTEVQHSPITMETIIDRCSFYDSKGIRVRWIFDFIDRYSCDKIRLSETYSLSQVHKYGVITYGPPIRFSQKYQRKYIHCLFNHLGFPKYDINLNIGIDYDKHTNTTLKIERMHKNGTGYGKLYSSMIIENKFMVSSYVLVDDVLVDNYPGSLGDYLKKYGFLKIDNNSWIRKNNDVCNIDEFVTIIDDNKDPVIIKYRGYFASDFIRRLGY